MSAVRIRYHPPRAVVAQLVRVPACHAGGRGFKSRPPRHFFKPFIPSIFKNLLTADSGKIFYPTVERLVKLPDALFRVYSRILSYHDALHTLDKAHKYTVRDHPKFHNRYRGPFLFANDPPQDQRIP